MLNIETEKCRGPFGTIFGDITAFNFPYLLTGFLALYPAGERENEGKEFRYNFEQSLILDLDNGFQTFGAGSKGGKFHVDFESAIQNLKFLQPERNK